jgi:two-component system invasion response regulator UvrY
MQYKIIIADDHEIVLEGVSNIIRKNLPESTLTCVTNLIDLKQELQNENFDLLILDIQIPGGNALQFVENMRAFGSSLPILVFSAYDEKLHASVYLKAGASGYLEKYAPPEQIMDAVKMVLGGRRYMGDLLKEFILDKTLKGNFREGMGSVGELSPREIEVARLLILGHGVGQIAEQLNLSSSAVGTYKKRIFEKLNVMNVVQLIKVFEKSGA